MKRMDIMVVGISQFISGVVPDEYFRVEAADQTASNRSISTEAADLVFQSAWAVDRNPIAVEARCGQVDQMDIDAIAVWIDQFPIEPGVEDIDLEATTGHDFIEKLPLCVGDHHVQIIVRPGLLLEQRIHGPSTIDPDFDPVGLQLVEQANDGRCFHQIPGSN